MANSTAINPWKLDSTGAVTTGSLYPRSVTWTGGTSGQQCILKDKNGNIVWQAKSAGADISQEINHGPDTGIYWNGLTVDTLASGLVLLYYE
jgi:hypothetical protein